MADPPDGDRHVVDHVLESFLLEWWEDLGRRAHRIALTRGVDPAEVLAETAARALEAGAEFVERDDQQRVAWFTKAMVLVAHELTRDEAAAWRAPPGVDVPGADDASEQAVLALVLRDVGLVLERLPELERGVWLAAAAGLTQNAIAVEFGLGRQTVRTLRSKANETILHGLWCRGYERSTWWA